MPNKSNKQSFENLANVTSYLNKLCQSSLEIEQRIYRLYRAAECNTPNELSSFLNVSISIVRDVEKSGEIPAEWLLFILRVKNVHPDWIVMAKGPIFVERTPEGHFESTESTMDYRERQKSLQHLSSYVLAEELLRRIAVRGDVKKLNNANEI